MARRILRFVLLFAVLLIGRAGAADNAAKVVFAYGAINAYMTATWIAREQGFFPRHKIEVEPVFIIASRAAQAMLAGEVQVGLIGPTHVVNAMAAGGDLVMFMGNQNSVRYQLVVHPSIKRAEDLKGKKVAIGASMGGLASLGAHVSLEHLGLNPRRDNITLLLTGEEPVRVAALQSGTVQATLLAPEMAQNLRGDGYAVLLDMGKLNIPFQASGMVTTRKMLRTNTRPIEGVARATLDSINFIRNPGNKRSVLQIITRNLRLANFARAEPAYNQLVEELPRNICPTLTGVRTIVKLMAELGINAKAAQIKSDDVVDVGLCKRLGGEAK